MATSQDAVTALAVSARTCEDVPPRRERRWGHERRGSHDENATGDDDHATNGGVDVLCGSLRLRALLRPARVQARQGRRGPMRDELGRGHRSAQLKRDERRRSDSQAGGQVRSNDLGLAPSGLEDVVRPESDDEFNGHPNKLELRFPG